MAGPFYSGGGYVGTVRSQAMGMSQNNNPYLALTVEVTGAVDSFNHDVIEVDHKLRTIYMYFTDSAQNIEINLKMLKSIGFERDSLRYLDPQVSGYHDFTGQEISLYCKHELYEGSPREKWSISTPREAREVKPVDNNALRKFDALYGKGLKAQATPKNGNGGQKKETVKSGAARPPDDEPFPDGDDVPF